VAGSFSHELRQPLASILSNAQAALRFLTRPQPNFVEVREAIADIVTDDQRACTIIEMLRSILKKRTVLIRRVDLNQTAMAVTRIVKSDAHMRGVNLRLELAPEPVIALGDEVPLQQVLLNLCNNGMDAMQLMSPGTRILTIRTTSCATGQSGCLFVEDTGTGLPEEIRAKLFTPFFTTKSKGLGIGLSICHSIVEGLKGEIRAINQPRGGASFCVALPLAELAAQSASHSAGMTQTRKLGGLAQ